MKRVSLKGNAILNSVKQICSILFPLISFPYISRTLGESGFGKYSFSLSIVNYFMLFAALGVNTYAIREGAKIRDDVNRLTKFCSEVFSINVISTVVSYLALFLVVGTSNKLGNYKLYIYILSLGIVIDTMGTDWVNSIFEDYFYISIRYIIMQVISLICMLLFVHSQHDVAIYCVIALIAAHGGNLFNILYVRKKVHIRLKVNNNFKKHIVPLLVLFLNSLAITIYVNSDITMLGYYTNDRVVGIYSFTSRIYNIVKSLINAIVVVSLPRIAYVQKNNSDELDRYMNDVFSMLFYFMLPLIAGLAGVSKEIILLVGGSQYVEGALSLQILSAAIVFAILSSYCTNCILLVNNQEKKCLIATVASSLINVFLNIFLLPIWGMNGAAVTTLIAELLNFLIQFYFANNIYGIKRLRFSNQISCIVGAVGILGICFITGRWLSGFVKLLVCVVLSTGFYFVVTFVNHNTVAHDIVHSIKNLCNRKIRL